MNDDNVITENTVPQKKAAKRNKKEADEQGQQIYTLYINNCFDSLRNASV